MAVYITATTSAFEELSASANRPPQVNVRRPLRGISIKEDTYAVLRVKRSDGEDIPIFDSSSPNFDEEEGIGRSSYYSNFIIQSYQDQRVEKQQIVQTFGEDYIFFFGEQPRFINVAGVLLNTKDFNWKNEFLENYERYLRGTRLVENNARLYMYFDDVVIEGYIVSSTINQMADQPYMVQFQFQMFVCQYATLSNVGAVRFQDLAVSSEEDSLAGEGLAPETPGARADAAATAARAGSPGGLNGFLATAGGLANDASLSVQRALEQIRNTFYGRSIVVPEGAGGAIRPPPLENKANITNSGQGAAIWDNYDEYPVRTPPEASFDEAELRRVKEELRLRTPEELEKQAREIFERAGIDTTRRETTYLLLGRGAFAATQYMAAFGVRQADGEINTAALSPDVLNNF